MFQSASCIRMWVTCFIMSPLELRLVIAFHSYLSLRYSYCVNCPPDMSHFASYHTYFSSFLWNYTFHLFLWDNSISSHSCAIICLSFPHLISTHPFSFQFSGVLFLLLWSLWDRIMVITWSKSMHRLVPFGIYFHIAFHNGWTISQLHR